MKRLALATPLLVLVFVIGFITAVNIGWISP